MYLNGKRLRAAAELRELTREQVEKRSGLDAVNFAYYWDYDATVCNQADVDALAKALNVKAATLLWSGLPKNVALRDDKFVTPEGGIEWDASKARKMFATDFTKRKPKKED